MIPETKHRLYAMIQAAFLLCPCYGIRHTYLSQTQGFGSSNLPADIFSRIDNLLSIILLKDMLKCHRYIGFGDNEHFFAAVPHGFRIS